MVHRRELDGEELILGNHGALYQNAMTWWDHATGSVWSQPLGEAIAGPLKGERLELLPSTLTRWDDWRAAHPGTLALNAGGGGGGFDLDAMVLVVDFTTDTVAVPVADLREVGVANTTVAGVELAVVLDPASEDRWTVLSRRLDDRVVTLAVVDDQLVDRETGTVWDPVRGRALEGPLHGEFLDLLPGFTAFPRDYRIFWPGGRVWEPGDAVGISLPRFPLNLRD